jgi:NMD protein affecting ribosome stability and mRNA decay
MNDSNQCPRCGQLQDERWDTLCPRCRRDDGLATTLPREVVLTWARAALSRPHAGRQTETDEDPPF